ncbi:MAG: MvaI/BcnI family restriction endonuclease [Porphyromonadaceae bacterium]|nr:MvaI/BcnI family restriction endonuclease [Porphyromonadaceae bacterium]
MSTVLKPISKETLIEQFHQIEQLGWIKNTTRKTNDGAAGNKLEDLLGIPENNLPIPNAAEWELKTQRDDTSSLLTLFHLEPSPQACKIVSNFLLPQYGWPHEKAGVRYPKNEMSFRATLSAKRYTRGFTIKINDKEKKVCIEFDGKNVLEIDREWLNEVEKRNGQIEKLEITPYWGYDDLFSKARTKLLNTFFVIFETRKDAGEMYFHYYKVLKLQNLSIQNFINAIRNGDINIDFDARTRHNHGTKFRINPHTISTLYETAEVVMDKPRLLP